MSSLEIKKVLNEIDGKDFSINVISKSGTTLEPALAYRVFKKKLIEKYGEEEAKKRIFLTTDPETGALREEANRDKIETFDIPLGVGGRYSVLSSVGLFPLAVAGVDIEKLLEGARECKASQTSPESIESSTLVSYAFTRFYLYDEENCDVEVLASFEPSLAYFNEWWKQLFGESEGKEKQGIFPASVIYSTDLHSLGQFMQEGRRNIFETFLRFSPNPEYALEIPEIKDSSDGLDYLVGKEFSEVSKKALEATVLAHSSGGISTIEIAVEDEENPGITEKSLGFLIFFFETACAISSFLHGVDPFDQPGVEKYKKEMYKLLGK